MKPMQFLSRLDGWTEKSVKALVENNGWYAWRRVDGGWMVFQMETDLRMWKGQR